MSIRNAIASVAVRDIASSVQWYARLFGRSADSTPAEELAEWKFEGGGWLQVYTAVDRAGSGSFTLNITSLDEQIADLERIGIAPGKRLINEKAKVVMIKDPDGNSIAFSEALDQTIAR